MVFSGAFLDFQIAAKFREQPKLPTGRAVWLANLWLALICGLICGIAESENSRKWLEPNYRTPREWLAQFTSFFDDNK
jgi:hypothetical protein